MGQRIEIESNRVVGDSVIVTTNRTLTGTDGEGYNSTDHATDSDKFGARLAVDLFESDDGINRVFVTSNVVIMQRSEGWSDIATESATDVISDFFLHY